VDEAWLLLHQAWQTKREGNHAWADKDAQKAIRPGDDDDDDDDDYYYYYDDDDDDVEMNG